MSAWDEDKAEIERTLENCSICPKGQPGLQEPREHSNYRCDDFVGCSVGDWYGRTNGVAPQQELNVACFGSCVVSHDPHPRQEV